MAVHQLGLPADLDPIEQVAKDHGIPVVEDAACAVGSRYKGNPIGSSGNLACFSFHPRKVIVCGEGGMITTNDPDLAARLRRLRHQGMSVSDLERHHADHVIVERYPDIGFNFRLSDLHAAVGLAQLRKLDQFLSARRAIAARYDAALRDIEEVESPYIPKSVETNYQSYIIRLRGVDQSLRDKFLNSMLKRGVATRRGLMASHLEPCYQRCVQTATLPHTEACAAQTMVLPVFTELEEDEQVYVVEQLRETIDGLL